jgi:hypothetical protein
VELVDINEWANNHSTQVAPSYVQDILSSDAGCYMAIVGKAGIGKSIMAMHLSFCIATGKPFYHFATKEAKVAYIAMEGGKTNWRDRMLKIIPQYSKTKNLKFLLSDPINLTVESKRNELVSACAGSQIVVFDNLRQVTGGKYLDPAYATDWLKIYQSFLKNNGFCGIFTHHMRKRDPRYLLDIEDVEQVKGATEYVDAADTILLLERARHRKNEAGKYLPANPLDITVAFGKKRIAHDEMPPLYLTQNYTKCSFDITPTLDLPSE